MGGGRPGPGGPRVEKGQKSFSFSDFFKLINRVHPKYWQLIVGIFTGLIATAANLVVPQFAQKIINSFKNLNMNLVIITGVVFFGGVIVSALSGYILGVFGEHVVSKLRDGLWSRLLKMPVSYFDNTSTGETSSRLVNDTSQVKNLLANTLPNAITSLLQFFGAVVIMFMMDWQMSLIMILAVPLVIFVLLPFMKLSGKIGRDRQDELANFSSDSTNVLSEIRLVKSSNSEQKELATGKKRIAKLYSIGVKESWVNSLMQPISNMLMMILVIGILTYSAIRVMQGSLTMGAFISFLMYLFQLMGPVIMVSQFFNGLAKTSGSTERIREMLNEPH
jgi:ATP-binding cassette subfamily B protein AbcA/BmrA